MFDVTVGVPTRNAVGTISRLLDAVSRQRTDKRIELLAIDWGSQDKTREILESRGVRIVEFPCSDFDWGSLRERLFAEASSPIVIHLSQDAVPANEDWLENLIRPLSDSGVGASCGHSLPDPLRPYRQFQWEKNGRFYFTGEMRAFRSRYGKGFSFANAAVRRDVWEKFHIDPQSLGEDFQFQMKLHAAGLRVAFADDAPVFHHHHYSFRRMIQRCANEGFALREMGFPYGVRDALVDLTVACPYSTWLREALRGRLRTLAEWLYPVARPVAVYFGSAWASKPQWY